MATTYTSDSLRNIFQSSFNVALWYSFLQHFFNASELKKEPERIIENTSDEGYYLGNINTTDSYRIGLFHYNIRQGSVANKRVGLRNLVKSFINPTWGEFDAALVVFDSGDHWRLSFICDIKGEATSPKRYTFVLGDKGSCYNTPVARFIDLQQKGLSFTNIKEAFSVEALSKDFYNKLYNWYLWALSEDINVTFPNNPNTEKDDRENINIKLIRMITRLLFVWFIKQKQLVPDSIFNPEQLKSILVDFDETSHIDGNYYNAILQNLFFATLNCAIRDEDGNPRRFATSKYGRDTRNLYRYKEMFQQKEEEILKLFDKVPFLNGGLFECLDKPKDLYLNQEYDIFYDGFSRNATKSSNGNFKYRAFVPNILFFNDDENQPGLINLLKQYNFTIEENSPTDAVISLDPELLGRVFENLLAAYNPETQESARKSTGSFYTPRPIVDYMVDEAIKTYLLGKRLDRISEEKLNALFKERTVSTDWTDSDKDAIANALKQVKILDPACGSGAFPMGCLLRIVDIIELLKGDTIDRYQLKLTIIENCVYGVDIQPIAMLICKLRFFISLICEQNDFDFNSPGTNFGINTLPNLETKFVAANTLISADIRNYEDDWTNDEKLDSMKEKLLCIRNDHFLAKGRVAKKRSERQDNATRQQLLDYIVSHAQKPDLEKIAAYERLLQHLSDELELYKKEVWVDKTHPVEQTLFGVVEHPDSLFREDINKKKRNELTVRIKATKAEIAKEQNKGEITGFEAAVKQITEWNPYDQNSVSSFFDPEWMFCLKEKFDIVIGNPPYIQLQNNGSELAKLYEPCDYKTFAKTGDIYCLFYERGWQLLKPKGHLCYITSNKWMRAGYGEKTRGFFAKNTNPQLLIDFAGTKIFDSATVDTNILLFSKEENTHKTICAVANKQNKSSLKNLSDFVRQYGTECDFSNSDSWVILSPIEQSIKRKIEAVGTPLKDWDIQINYGIKTGCNEAFIITSEKRNEILANCQSEDERKRTAELIRPILRGRDIKRYGYDWAGLYLIYIPWHFPFQFDATITGASEKAEKAFKEQYPAVYAHMLQYKEPLSKRNKAETGIHYEWYAMQRWGAKYWEDFNKPKIMYPNMTKYLPFYYDEKGFYQNDKSFMITGKHVSYLAAFLNSSLFKFCFRDCFPELLGGTRELRKIFFDKIPVLQVSDEIDSIFKETVTQIQSDYTKEQALVIDNLLFDLYNLTIEERNIIGYIEIT